MENDSFTIVVHTYDSFSVETFFGTRKEAEKRFDARSATSPPPVAVFLYSAKEGYLNDYRDGD